MKKLLPNTTTVPVLRTVIIQLIFGQQKIQFKVYPCAHMYPGYRTCTGTKINKNREKHERFGFFFVTCPYGIGAWPESSLLFSRPSIFTS